MHAGEGVAEDEDAGGEEPAGVGELSQGENGAGDGPGDADDPTLPGQEHLQDDGDEAEVAEEPGGGGDDDGATEGGDDEADGVVDVLA